MPRDDLSIDFVKRMPLVEALDPALIIDEWTNRAQNLAEEIRFLQDEIAAKDAQVDKLLKEIEDRDNRIQKWIKANGSHGPQNPKEDEYRETIRRNYEQASKLSDEKVTLSQKLQLTLDKHIRQLDVQIKVLYDRAEPGFGDPDETPSLVRKSAANAPPVNVKSVTANGTGITGPLAPIPNGASQASVRANNPTLKTINTNVTSSSAPATPAASMIMNRQVRESSAGPSGGAPKRGPRTNSGLGSMPTTSSGLARHSSLGPGTPKAHTATGAQRAGSAGPRASTKASTISMGRKGTPSSGPGRKKGTPAAVTGPNKSGLSRVKRAAKNSPTSTAESELSDVDSGSGDDSDSRTGGRGTPAARSATKHAPDDDSDHMDLDDDDAGDDKKYCICQNVSFGDMVACDNDDCPFEWFHWSCVGLKSEPNGTWYCPVCTESMKKKAGK
ncbi:hypothetical protein GQ53DRAFT_661876 [Thozetella sp. PMI_491]|nr:hypothetical protein GQ53DRAFT_661876 [Thozetella sp. PMI_491]